MTEDFLHYIWKYKLLKGSLKLNNGDTIEIIHPGSHNSDAGPDFFNAKIRINDTIWAGNIEIHVNSSDWQLHNHQLDLSYDNIILHIVYSDNKSIFRQNGELIPQLEIKYNFDLKLFLKYQDFITNKNWIPCEKIINNSTKFTIDSWLECLLIDRLERKTAEIKSSYIRNNNNWEETFYQILAKNFGFKLNSSPFEYLSHSIPLSILAKHKNNEIQISALLFGQSGLLNQFYTDDYPLILNKEYEFLRKKYNLSPIKGHLWKFLRLRPANFPTIRISQFSDLICNSSHLFSRIIESETLADLYNLFNIKAFSYFDNHYMFDEKLILNKSKVFGKSATDLIIINTVVPILFFYAQEKDDKTFQNRALFFLEQIDAENNSTIKKWLSIGIKSSNAYISQGLLELKNNYCDKKKCLQCRIGNELLKKN
jgi:hypothetical protein